MTRLSEYSNANVYCQQSDPRTFGHQYGHWAEVTDCCHPIEFTDHYYYRRVSRREMAVTREPMTGN